MKKGIRCILVLLLISILTITSSAMADTTPTPTPTSPFVLTDEFAAKLTPPTESDTAIALTTDATKFTGADDKQKDDLPSGLWAKTASDDKGQILYGDPEHTALLEDGYVDPQSITLVALPDDTRTVIASALRGRPMPNTDYEPLLILKKGDKVYCLAEDEGWTLVLTKDGHVAYVASKYLSGTPKAKHKSTQVRGVG